ncbi:MAG: beta-galactosidase trimerization domain-containing protein [Clostridia bacterium]
MERIPYRQIHLDFHTNSAIDGIGERFDAETFVATLKRAHVNSINLFAKCHHGMYYYPTKIGTMHPHLKFDLFGAQLKACRENDIRALAYTCVGWNEDWADRHPEWLVVDYNGVLGNHPPFSKANTMWRTLCISNPAYRALLKAELKEIYDLYHPQGFWIDIVLGKTCICRHCREEMRACSLNPELLEDVRRHDMMAETDFCREFFGFLKELDPALEIYFNNHPYRLDDARDEEISSVEKRKYFSFIDIESLPSEEWGYTHYPVAINYVGHCGLETTMMNGKFHTSWGDFGTLRNLEALEYECFRAIANGSKICIGDQLHPCGKLDDVVYERIGRVFSSVEEKEPWLHGSRKLCDVAVMISSPALMGDANCGNPVEEAAYRVLSELHIPFDFVNQRESLNAYQLIILPDNVRVDDETAARLNDFTKQGGKLLLTGKSGLAMDADRFVLDCVGCTYKGCAPYAFRYVRLTDACFEHIPAIDQFLCDAGETVCLESGHELAEIVDPYFDRTYDQFCSHRQTPPKLEPSGESAIIETANGIYVSAPLFESYLKRGNRTYRDILDALIKRLYSRPLVKTNLPTITETTVRAIDKTVMVHLLNYVIQRKCRMLDTIEERFEVSDRQIAIRTDFAPTSVRLVPEGKPLRFIYKDGYVNVQLEKISGHTMIEIV